MTYVPRMPPRIKQAEALERLAAQEEFFGLLMAMRTGKTKTALDDFGRLFVEGRVDDLLVIAPAGALDPWVPAMKEHLGAPLDTSLDVLHWNARMSGTNAKARVREFIQGQWDGPRALLVNIEALSSVERARNLVMDFLNQGRVYTVIDESTAIKNPTSKRTKFILKEVGPRSAFRRILCGLVSPQGPLDVWAQFEFLKPGCLGFRTFNQFKDRYAITRLMSMGGRMFKQIVGYRDEADLAQRMTPFSFRVRLEDCYDMPESDYSTRSVPMTPEQERLYRDMKAFSTVQLEAERHVTATIALTQILRLHQILCGATMDDDGIVHEISNNRTDAVLEILEEYDGKAIIWCAYDHSIREVSEALRKRYGHSSTSRFWGGNRESREEEEKKFQSDPACRFMVATASAGGKGRMWAAADLVIYHSSTTNLEHRQQSEERPKTVGKVKPIIYIDLVTPGTVDEKIIETLKRKDTIASTIQGDSWRKWLE